MPKHVYSASYVLNLMLEDCEQTKRRRAFLSGGLSNVLFLTRLLHMVYTVGNFYLFILEQSGSGPFSALVLNCWVIMTRVKRAQKYRRS